MSPRTVDRLNIGLMLVALAAAFALPFEVFLFSYAVLGPLHYLTEISWLHERQFFARGKHDWWWLVALACVAVLGAPFVMGKLHIAVLQPYGQIATFLAFAIAFAFALLRDATLRALFAILAVVITLTFADVNARSWFMFALLTTTILHVSLFTGVFMLYGALKARSRAGYVACALFALACGVALFAPAAGGTPASDYVKSSYKLFSTLNAELARMLGWGTQSTAGGAPAFAQYSDVFVAPGAVAIMRLIAFAYTYHYLNWFSKTSIIGWHKVDRAKLATAVVLWIASLALYAQSFEVGARWLFLLSYAHVLLEFPLNHLSFVGVGQEVWARVRAPRTAA